MEIVLGILGPATDGISQHLEGVRAIGHRGLWRGVTAVILLRFSPLVQGQQTPFSEQGWSCLPGSS